MDHYAYHGDLTYDPLFRQVAAASGVPFALLKGIAATESAFNPRSITYEPSHMSTPQPGDHDASRGLMQTTQEAAVTNGWPAGKPFSDLDDPLTSITMGAREISRYLNNPTVNVGPKSRHMVATGGSRLLSAIAAYNMGFPRGIDYTTPGIASLNGYTLADIPALKAAGAVYANQRYVNSVWAHMKMYDALERGDLETAAKYKADIVHETLPMAKIEIGAGLVLFLVAGYGAFLWWIGKRRRAYGR